MREGREEMDEDAGGTPAARMEDGKLWGAWRLYIEEGFARFEG